MLDMDTIGYYNWMSGGFDTQQDRMEKLANEIIYNSRAGKTTEINVTSEEKEILRSILESKGAYWDE